MLESNFRELERLFLALGDKTRLRLLALMADGPVSVGFLADKLGDSQPKVSRHLAYLRNANIVYTERDGKWIYYGILYPEDKVLSRVLDTVVGSIAAIREDGESVYFTDEQVITEEPGDLEIDIYTQEHQTETEDDFDEYTQGEYVRKAEEMDIFLL